jgi:hypothetical protein
MRQVQILMATDTCPARRCDTNPPPSQRRITGDLAWRSHRAMEVVVTRRVRLWVAAVLIAAASGLMAAVAVTATTGVNHAPAHVYLAGITFNGID